MISPDRFLKIGSYLPSAVLISVAMMFGGLSLWVNVAWVRDTAEGDEKIVGAPTPLVIKEKWIKRRRPALKVLSIIIATHALGSLLFFVITRACFIEHRMVYSFLSPCC
jgi:glycosylphosphatidylinositol transamidase